MEEMKFKNFYTETIEKEDRTIIKLVGETENGDVWKDEYYFKTPKPNDNLMIELSKERFIRWIKQVQEQEGSKRLGFGTFDPDKDMTVNIEHPFKSKEQ